MASVLTFWQLPEEELDLFEYLRGTGDILAFASRAARNKEELAPLPLIEYIEKHNPTQFEFGLERDVLSVTFDEVERLGETLFYVSNFSNNIITFRRGLLRNRNMLGMANLSAHWSYFRDNGRTAKSDDFVKWGKNIFNFARKRTSERLELNGTEYPATRRAKAAYDSSEIIFTF